MDYKTFETLRSYCRTDLAAYIDTPTGKEACFLLEGLHGAIGELQHEQETAMRLFQCKDLTPREKHAAHLLAVINNHRAMTWQREPTPPGGKEPAPALTPEQNASAWKATRDAVEEYAFHIPEREAAALLKVFQAGETAGPVPEVQATENKQQRQDRRLKACIDVGLQMETRAALSRLPDGVGRVADTQGVTRQSFSIDVKAALKRREIANREGVKGHRA